MFLLQWYLHRQRGSIRQGLDIHSSRRMDRGMNEAELKSLRNIWLDHAKKASALGREVLLHYFGQLEHIGDKGRAGLVSEADVESEKVIQKYLEEKTPQFSFLGEEE